MKQANFHVFMEYKTTRFFRTRKLPCQEPEYFFAASISLSRASPVPFREIEIGSKLMLLKITEKSGESQFE